MDSLSTVVTIAEIILFVALTILCFYIITTLKKANKTIEEAGRSISEIQAQADRVMVKLEPVLDNLSVITDDVKSVSGSAKDQMEKVDSIVTSVKDTTDSIIKFEQKAQKQIEGEVFDALNAVSAVVIGVKTFISKLKGTNGSYRPRKKSYSSSEDFEEEY